MEKNYGAKTFLLQRFIVHLRPVVADVPRVSVCDHLSTSQTRGRAKPGGGSAALLGRDE